MNKDKIKVETVGKPQFNRIDRFAAMLRKFYADPKNLKEFEEWKKAGATV